MKNLSIKNSTAFKSVTVILATGLLFSANSYAASVKTAGQAMALCTEEAEKAHPDYKRSKSKNIKQKRGVFTIKLKVVTESGSVKTVCEVDKEGTVTYTKA